MPNQAPLKMIDILCKNYGKHLHDEQEKVTKDYHTDQKKKDNADPAIKQKQGYIKKIRKTLEKNSLTDLEKFNSINTILNSDARHKLALHRNTAMYSSLFSSKGAQFLNAIDEQLNMLDQQLTKKIVLVI